MNTNRMELRNTDMNTNRNTDMNTNRMELSLNEMGQATGGVHFVDTAKGYYNRITRFTRTVAIPSFEYTAQAAGDLGKDMATATKNLGTAAVNWVKGLFD